MKKKVLLSLISLLITFTAAIAQKANLVFFSEAGEKFTLYVNGVAINAKPETNVKAQGLEPGYVKARVVVDDKYASPIIRTIELTADKEDSYSLKKGSKGYVARFLDSKALPKESVTAIASGASRKAEPFTEPVPNSTATASTSMGEATSGTAVRQNDNSINMTMDVNEGGENASMDVSFSVQGEGMNFNVTQENSSASTSSKVSSKGTSTYSSTTTTSEDRSTKKTSTANKPANEPKGCAVAMSSADFTSAKQSVQKQSFAEEKMIVAKQITKNNCLSTNQVKQVMQLFSFEEDKLDYAKFAYDYTTDKQNYYHLNDVFSFSDSVIALDAYLSDK